jgi:hypothetical protein
MGHGGDANAEPLLVTKGRRRQQGERFIIQLEADAGREADCSKPMSASDARTALHKLGTSNAVIESMFDRARNASREDTHA